MRRVLSGATSALAICAVAGVAALAAPAPTHAEPLRSEAGGGSCTVETAQLNWGVKESFRSYISGSIANGSWTVSDDMRYETPDFIWDRASGDFSDALDSGRISFTGAIHFTGHDGAMELDIANPAIEFAGDDTAYLYFGVGATDTANAGGTVAVSEVRAAKLDLSGAVESSGSELRITSAPARLTAEGASALNGDYGSYVSGEEIDPVTLQASGSGCELAESTAAPAPTEAASGGEVTAKPEPIAGTAESEAGVPWLPIGIGIAALLVIGVTVGMLIGGRKRPAAQQNAPTQPGDTPGPASQ